MFVLGIETSCDETGVSVVRNGKVICSNVTATSVRHHAKFGGIIPEIASRAQLEYMLPVLEEALYKAKVQLKDIKLVAVTKGPGLIGSLLVGISFAKSLSFARSIPLIGVDHVLAHLYPVFLDRRINPEFPFVGLVVSGGHTNLYHCRRFDKFRLSGQTLDDAAGEAFDKVAKLLNLGYPGGPVIEKAAKRGNKKAFVFRCHSKKDNFNFSFSGIKTAVLYAVRDLEKKGKLDVRKKCDLAASFQYAVVNSLVEKTISFIRSKKIRVLVVGGGVIANQYFRQRIKDEARRFKIDVFVPPQSLCTDNAAMIAGMGYKLFKLGKQNNLNLKPMLS